MTIGQAPRRNVALICFFLVGALSSSHAGLPGPAQKPQVAGPTAVEMNHLLVVARDALIQVAVADSASYNGRISGNVEELVGFFLELGDRESVRVLQAQLSKTYAKEIRNVLKASETPADLAKQLEELEAEKSEFRDHDIHRVVKLAIARGFFTNATTYAAHIQSNVSRTLILGEIAVAAKRSGQVDSAERAAQATIEAGCQKPPEKSVLSQRLPEDTLIRLAKLFDEGGLIAAARQARILARGFLESSPFESSSLWGDLAESAARGSDFELAAVALQRVDPGLRESVEQQIVSSRIQQAEIGAALKLAAQTSEADRRSQQFLGIAKRQRDAGDAPGAEHSIALAMQAASQADEWQASCLTDIAWDQALAGNRAGAERTLTLAMQANDAEKFESTKISGWIGIAETFALLGDFEKARAVAQRITDHSGRADTWSVISNHQVYAGQWKASLEWALALQDPEERCSALLGIAKAVFEQQKQPSSHNP